MSETIAAASWMGFVVGLMVGFVAGVVVCRWLWINGQMQRERARWRRLKDNPPAD